MGRNKLNEDLKMAERIVFRIPNKEKEMFEKIIEIQDKKMGDILRNYIEGYIKAYSDLLDNNNKVDK